MKGKTLIIAEAGVNHNGDIELAKKLIDVAADAGADLVKFQTFNANRLVTHTAKKADYQNLTTNSKESQYEMLHRLELTDEMHDELIRYCEKRDIDFFSTGFDVESIELLDRLGMKCFKVPSGEITNLPYLRYIAQIGKPVIVSTGMATMGEIEAAISVFENAGISRDKITVLHCTTEYPTPMNEVNLQAMQSLKKAFGVKIGYSDHTRGIEVPVAAVAMGATVIEKHFTLDRNMPGPDHKASLEPDELKSMIVAIRNIESAIGDGIKRPTKSELRNRKVARKSLVASQIIKKGECFTLSNISSKRPGTGISPMCLDKVIGRPAPRDFLVDELIEI